MIIIMVVIIGFAYFVNFANTCFSAVSIIHIIFREIFEGVTGQQHVGLHGSRQCNQLLSNGLSNAV